MSTGLVSWSKTASSNATADANINFAEGQAPSSVNDSARALMASAAMFRDDNAGSLTTAGTSTAYTLTTSQTFASLSAMSGQTVVFVAHTTSGAAPTLNVDTLGAKAIHAIGGTAIATGALLENGIYAATYDNANSRWVVHGVVGALTGAVIATQAQQETGTDATVAVTSGRQHFHQSAAKGWAKCDGASATADVSYNVSSTTDDATGVISISWATDFSSGDYVPLALASESTGGPRFCIVSVQNAGSTRFICMRTDISQADPNDYFCAAFGDQA